MKPLVIAALADEIRILKSKMVVDSILHFKPAILYRGQYWNKEINLLVTGMGADRMQKGLQHALNLCEPSTIACIGYCGGASPIAALGMLIVASAVVDYKDDSRWSAAGSLVEGAKKICEDRRWPYQIGGLVTVDRIIHSPYEKADIGITARAIALDMEAAIVARMASERNIPFLTVKSVLDPMEMVLPHFEDCIDESGAPQPSKLLNHFINTPQNLLKLPQLQYCAFQARKSLSQFLGAWLKIL